MERYPEPSNELNRGGVVALLKYFGPGAIIASVTIGSGETVFASRGGALFGYALLWCFVGGGIMKFVQVYSAARLITLTGEHPIERCDVAHIVHNRFDGAELILRRPTPVLEGGRPP